MNCVLLLPLRFGGKISILNHPMKKNNFNSRLTEIIFLILIFCVLSFFYSIIFRPQKDISIEENRTLQKVPSFSLGSFADGTYQKQMEDAIGDQLLFSIQIKYGVKQVFNQLTEAFSKINYKSEEGESVKTSEIIESRDDVANDSTAISLSISASDNQPTVQVENKPHYTYREVVANKLYKLDDSGYIVEKPHAPEEYCFELYDPAMLAAVTYPKYLFFIENSESTDFNDLKKYNAFEYVKKQMPMTGYDCLSYNSFEEYKKYFYQTDHHWNYYGSYIGYTKIIKMLEGEDVNLLVPVGIHVYDTVYNGSLARDNLLRCATEKFTVYEYNLPPYKTYVNDEEKEYGYRSYYVSDDDFPHKTYANHYGMYYGDDWAKVVYDFNQPEKENLLILGTSFTNSVNELIASHYNKTHVLDFRYYRKQYGQRIDAQRYMTENNISKMVIIGNISSLGFREKK